MHKFSATWKKNTASIHSTNEQFWNSANSGLVWSGLAAWHGAIFHNRKCVSEMATKNACVKSTTCKFTWLQVRQTIFGNACVKSTTCVCEIKTVRVHLVAGTVNIFWKCVCEINSTPHPVAVAGALKTGNRKQRRASHLLCHLDSNAHCSATRRS